MYFTDPRDSAVDKRNTKFIKVLQRYIVALRRPTVSSRKVLFTGYYFFSFFSNVNYMKTGVLSVIPINKVIATAVSTAGRVQLGRRVIIY